MSAFLAPLLAQIKPNATFLCRIEHSDSNDKVRRGLGVVWCVVWPVCGMWAPHTQRERCQTSRAPSSSCTLSLYPITHSLSLSLSLLPCRHHQVWALQRNKAWNGGVRLAPQKVKILSVSAC